MQGKGPVCLTTIVVKHKGSMWVREKDHDSHFQELFQAIKDEKVQLLSDVFTCSTALPAPNTGVACSQIPEGR